MSLVPPSYNPKHPQADWSGFVPPPTSKKHHPNPNPCSLTSTSSAITPLPHIPTNEWTHPYRRHSLTNKNSSLNTTKNTFSLIGGPIPINDPRSVSSCQWESEAQAAAAGKKERTSVSVLTDRGRAMQVRGVKEVIPAFASGEVYDEERFREMKRENPYFLNDAHGEETVEHQKCEERRGENDDGFLVGYRVPQLSRSFLEGLGKDLINNKGNAKSIVENPKYVSSAPYATDGDLKTDPYDLSFLGSDCGSERGGRRKDLLLENYSSAVPGYTGKRRDV